MSERLATADPSLIADPVNETGNHPRRAATTPVTTVQESKTLDEVCASLTNYRRSRAADNG